MKKILKSIPGIGQLKKIADKRKEKAELQEVYKRAKDFTFMKDNTDEEIAEWKERIRLVKECPDTAKINVQDGCAKLEGDYFIMHNGIKIQPLSYYGYPMLQLLHENKGIHEPQEEYVFQEVLKGMKDNAVMIELGAYWSFYSMWFNKVVKNATNYMLEPWNLEFGKKNFRINNLTGSFYQYYISKEPGFHHDGNEIISIDKFVKDNKIEFIDILHSDIQGSEFDMLQGAISTLKNNKVGYIFVSTHSNEIHDNCSKFLDDLGFIKLCSANMDETFSTDGLLVYKHPDYEGINEIQISIRKS